MKSFLILLVTCFSFTCLSQSPDIALLTATLLGETPIEEDLQELCDQIGGRETGSPANAASIEWGLRKFQEAGVMVWRHPFTMPSLWREKATTAKVKGDVNFDPIVVSKYYSPPGTHIAPLVDGGMGTQVDFARLGEKAKNAFVLVETELCLDINGLFQELTNASNTEDYARAAGVKGLVFMSSRPNGLLYRFITKRMMDNEMPQIVMARENAQRCLRSLRNAQKLSIEIRIDAEVGADFQSANVIAEIPGSTKPEEVIIIGSHLDSWALGTGANDNGCNVALMIDIARQMQKLGINPQRTIRFALWNGEEQGFFGSHAYTKQYASTLDDHVMALSIDIGSGGIIGFFTNGRAELVPLLDTLLRPVGAFGPYNNINVPVVGTDNFDFMLEGIPNLIGNHKAATYGPNYHAASDTYDKVDLHSLKINSAIVAAMVLGYANAPDSMIPRNRHTRAQVQETIDNFNLEFQMRMFGVWDDWVRGERGRQ